MEFSRKYGQWTLTAGDDDYSIVNLDADGGKKFYECRNGAYGNPVIEAEPDLAIFAPASVEYRNSKGGIVTPSEKIAGIICKIGDEIRERFSFSNPKKPDLAFENEGAELVIDGVRWHLRALFSKDKNRIIGYDAFYGDQKPDFVKVVELADLNF
jgi:hypothetical protein